MRERLGVMVSMIGVATLAFALGGGFVQLLSYTTATMVGVGAFVLMGVGMALNDDDGERLQDGDNGVVGYGH